MLERRLWVLWFQGYERASEGVRRCIDSWRDKNPGWEVTLVTNENVRQWVSAELIDHPRLGSLPDAARSDLIRLDLLSRFGGVWADASCWCSMPLDSWIDGCVEPAGFFAFSWLDRPAPFPTLRKTTVGGFTANSLISSWFLAATRGHLLVERHYGELRDYWAENSFSNERHRILRRLLDELLTRNDRTTQWYVSPFVARVLRISPYFAFHYHFNKIVTHDRRCRALWDQMTRLSAVEPHLPQQLGLRSPMTDRELEALAKSTAPVFKLSWHGPFEPGSVFDFVTSDHERSPGAEHAQRPAALDA